GTKMRLIRTAMSATAGALLLSSTVMLPNASAAPASSCGNAADAVATSTPNATFAPQNKSQSQALQVGLISAVIQDLQVQALNGVNALNSVPVAANVQVV